MQHKLDDFNTRCNAKQTKSNNKKKYSSYIKGIIPMKKLIFNLASLAVLLLFCTASNANARIIKTYKYTVDSNNWYVYEWHENEKGEKWTEWTYGNEPQIKYEGHVMPGPGIVFIQEENSYKTEAGVYKYKWLRGRGGKLWTTWTFNGEPQKNYEGHVIPGPRAGKTDTKK